MSVTPDFGWQICLKSPQGLHQPGDPGGHRDQTQPSLPDQWGGPSYAARLCCHGDRLRRGGASGLQLQKGRGSVLLCAGTVAGDVGQGGAQRRHPGSAGEHPQRPGDVGHAVGRHCGADVGRLRLASPQELPAAAARLLQSPEPPHRRPSMSRGQQRHPVRLREAQLSGLHKNWQNPEHLPSDLVFPLLPSSIVSCFSVWNTDTVRLLLSVLLIYRPASFLSKWSGFYLWDLLFTPWCKMPWLLKQKRKKNANKTKK